MPKPKPPQPPKSQPDSQSAQPTPPATTVPVKNASTKAAASSLSASKPTSLARTPAVSAKPAATRPLTAFATVFTTAADIDSSPDTASLADPAQQAIARAKYQALHDQISATRETLPGNDTANRTLLRDRAEEAQEVLTTLDRNDLQANTPAFNAAATQIQQANNDMDDLKNSIGGIIHNIQAVADFVQITNEAVSAAAKFIA